jgi:hypothetical protein
VERALALGACSLAAIASSAALVDAAAAAAGVLGSSDAAGAAAAALAGLAYDPSPPSLSVRDGVSMVAAIAAIVTAMDRVLSGLMRLSGRVAFAARHEGAALAEAALRAAPLPWEDDEDEAEGQGSGNQLDECDEFAGEEVDGSGPSRSDGRRRAVAAAALAAAGGDARRWERRLPAAPLHLVTLSILALSMVYASIALLA